MGFEEVHYFVNYVVMMKTVNREAAQFSENKSKRALKEFSLAQEPCMGKAEFATESYTDNKIPAAGMGPNNDHAFFQVIRK
jgi:hypothetical protein